MFWRKKWSSICKWVCHVPGKQWRHWSWLMQVHSAHTSVIAWAAARKHVKASCLGVVCFMTSRWACPQQIAEYVKPLGIMLWVNTPPTIGSRSSGLEICLWDEPLSEWWGPEDSYSGEKTAKPRVSLHSWRHIGKRFWMLMGDYFED